MNRVVITGIGLVTPVGIGKEDFWNSNIYGRSGTKSLPKFDKFHFESTAFGYVDDFNPLQFGLKLSEIRRMDRLTQFAIVAADEAVIDAKIDWKTIDKERVGVNIANAVAGTKFMDEEFLVLTNNGMNDYLSIEDVSPYAYSKSMPNTTSNEIAGRYGLKGSCCTISTGCTAGIDSIGFLFDEIRLGNLDMAIGGASEAPITPITIAAFESVGTLSKHNIPCEKASRPFDATRNGFVLAEASAIVILEEYKHARKRGAHIYGEIKSYSSGNNAIHMTGLQPDGEDLANVIENAIYEAGINKEDIGYINAHGSGTKQNDNNETGAFKRVFKDWVYNIPISSTKSMLGHSLGAASAVEIIVCCFVLETQIIHPTINYENRDEYCDLNYVPNNSIKSNVKYVLTDASGFSGIHSALILGKI